MHTNLCKEELLRAYTDRYPVVREDLLVGMKYTLQPRLQVLALLTW